MANYLDTLLRDSAEGELFCPTEPPTFPPAVTSVGVPMREQPPLERTVVELAQPSGLTPFADVTLLTALLFRVRPRRDPDRFTLGIALVSSVGSGEQGDPYPILF
jgi:hypothetical protein